jgi:hypothetical protein
VCLMSQRLSEPAHLRIRFWTWTGTSWRVSPCTSSSWACGGSRGARRASAPRLAPRPWAALGGVKPSARGARACCARTDLRPETLTAGGGCRPRWELLREHLLSELKAREGEGESEDGGAVGGGGGGEDKEERQPDAPAA